MYNQLAKHTGYDTIKFNPNFLKFMQSQNQGLSVSQEQLLAAWNGMTLEMQEKFVNAFESNKQFNPNGSRAFKTIPSINVNAIEELNPQTKAWDNVAGWAGPYGEDFTIFMSNPYSESSLTQYWNPTSTNIWENTSPWFFKNSLEDLWQSADVQYHSSSVKAAQELVNENGGAWAPSKFMNNLGEAKENLRYAQQAWGNKKFINGGTLEEWEEAVEMYNDGKEQWMKAYDYYKNGDGVNFNDNLWASIRNMQPLMDFYFNKTADGAAAWEMLQGETLNMYQVSASEKLVENVTAALPEDAVDIDIRIMEQVEVLKEKSTFNSSLKQIGSSDQEWTEQDALDMAQVNMKMNSLLDEKTEAWKSRAQEIFEAGGVTQQEAIDQAEQEVVGGEIQKQLDSLPELWKDIISRRLDPNKATPIIDVSTGQMLRPSEEDLTPEQNAEMERIQTLKQDLTSGVFASSKIQAALEKYQLQIVLDMKNIAMGVDPSKAGMSLFGITYGTGSIGYLDTVGELFGKSTKEQVEEFDRILAKYEETGLIELPTLVPIHNGTDFAKKYNKTLNTVKALSEVYLLNYDPILSLENKKARITTGFFGVNEKGQGYRAQAADRVVEGIKDGWEEAVGKTDYDLSNDMLQQEFVNSAIADLGVKVEWTTEVDEETGERYETNTLQQELDKKLDNVSNFYNIGRQVPTFAIMAIETALIEVATVGLGSEIALANIGRKMTQIYRGLGVGRKTATIMGGWSKAMLHEAMILEGSNQLGSHLWGRERMPVWSFAFGATAARLGIGRLAKVNRGFNQRMITKAAQGSPLAQKWTGTQRIIKNNPLLLGQPLALASYVPKKMLQAGIGTATIKAGELTSTLADVFNEELTWKEWWDHALDADSLIETYGAMLVMGTRTGLKDIKMGYDVLSSNVKNLGQSAGTKKFNQVAEMFNGHLRKIKNYSDKNPWQSSWTEGEINLAREKRIQEIKADKSLDKNQKLAAITNLNQLSDFLKIKEQVDNIQREKIDTENRIFGKGTLAGTYNEIINQLRAGQDSGLMGQVNLGNIARMEVTQGGRDRMVLDIMESTGMDQFKAKEYLEWCENLAKVNERYKFKPGSKEQRKFFKLQSEGYELNSRLEGLKEAYKKGQINKTTLDIESENIKAEQLELYEKEKLALKENEAAIVEGERALKKNITKPEYIEVKEGKTVDQTINELLAGKEKMEGDKVDIKADKSNVDINETVYGAEVTVKSKDGKSAKTYIVTEPVKARTAQADFGKGFERSKPMLAEGQSFKLTNTKKATLFHELVHPLVEKQVGENKGFVKDFIDLLKDTGEYDLVKEAVMKHGDVKGNSKYVGSEWITIWAEMVKEGKLDEFITKDGKRPWNNIKSKLNEVINKDTEFKDFDLTTAEGTKNFLLNFAKAEGRQLKKLSKVANKAIEEYQKWELNKSGEVDAVVNKASIKDAEPAMIQLYKENAADWAEGGWKKALTEMEQDGLLDNLIAAHLPRDRFEKGWTKKMDANYVQSVYSEMSQLVKGFSEAKQTKSGAKGFFAYINSFLHYKALNISGDMGIFETTKSLDQMKESKGFDITAAEASTEVYKRQTSGQTARQLSLNETSIADLNREIKSLDFPTLVEKMNAPKGPNQTISPFLREFKQQFGPKAEKAIKKSMGKNKAEYKTWLSKNFPGIVKNVPIGYLSKNFPWLVESNKYSGSTGRDKRWTSGPDAIKVKENITEADISKFVNQLTEVGRISTKKNALAYQLGDSYGTKKLIEAVEQKNEIEYELDKVEKDFEQTRLEYDRNEITKKEFDLRRDDYMSHMKELLAQGGIIEEFGKAFKTKDLDATDVTQKIQQEIEISNFRKSSTLAKDVREFSAKNFEDPTKELELRDAISVALKERMPLIIEETTAKINKEEYSGWDAYTMGKANVWKKAFQEALSDFEFEGFKFDSKLIDAMARETASIAKKVGKGHQAEKSRIVKEAKVVDKEVEAIKSIEQKVKDFELERTLDKTAYAEQALGKLQETIMGTKTNATELLKTRYKDGQAAGKKHLIEEINKGKTVEEKAKIIERIYNRKLDHLTSAGHKEGHRLQVWGAKGQVFESLAKNVKTTKGKDGITNKSGIIGKTKNSEGVKVEWTINKKGDFGNLKINGEKVKGDKASQDPKSVKKYNTWMMEAAEMGGKKWAEANPEKFKELSEDLTNRKRVADEFKESVVDEMEYVFREMRRGKLDSEVGFLLINQLNSTMSGGIRAAAGLGDIMIPFKGDKLKDMTIEHKRAADSMLRELATLMKNETYWEGNKLSETGRAEIMKALESYETAIVETSRTKGDKNSFDKMLEDYNKVDNPNAFEVVPGGERYDRGYTYATFGDPRARAMVDAKKFIESGGDIDAAKYGKAHETAAKIARNEKVKAADRKVVDNIIEGYKEISKGKTKQELIEVTKTSDKALNVGREINPVVKKARVFDFDDTVARTNSKVFATKGGEKKILTAEEFAKEGERLVNEGWKMDFSDFNKVVEGKKGPLFDLMKKMKEAPGERDMFILTARSQESAKAIHTFLKEMGIDIPLENIKGLGNSTGAAKAEWLVEKAAEGYNDFYFADDHMANVKAVKEALEPIDVKSQVQQARLNRSSEVMDKMFNQIIENKTGIEWQKEFSDAKAKIRGKENQKRKFWLPPSAEDFSGLMDYTLGKGKLGEQQREFYNETLYKPYSRATQSMRADRVNMMSDFKALKAELDVPKNLREKTKSGFTKEQAVRTYLWNKAGHEIPRLSKTDLVELTKIIDAEPDLRVFAESILQLTKGDGYNKPGSSWLAGTITTDLIDILNTTKRRTYLQEWNNNVDVIFSKKNLNKLEAAYGPKYREALENSLARMKSGKNRIESGNRLSDRVLDYINNAQGAIMFLNSRSAILQTISATNFINMGFNNPIKAGKAFANQPQYWKDFMEIMNSKYLLDRRNGLKINISESEIADAASTSTNKAKAAVAYILEKGYAPTRFADSFAIASGGATWFRNRINDLVKKQGMSEAEAKAKTWEEFIEISEKSQQSSDPSKISQQQSSDLGRILLQFVNTPMQYARIQKADFKDLINGRGSAKEKIGRILYYGVMQNLWFNVMQQGAFALGFGDSSDEDVENKTMDVLNGGVDSILRGIGFAGMTVSVVKNLLLDIHERSGRDRPEYSDAWETLLEFSPAIKSKLKKIKSAGRPFDSKSGRQSMIDKGFSLDNPAYESFAKVFSATTNIPLDRLLQKVENLRDAGDDQNAMWMRIAMAAGWPKWQLQTTEQRDEDKKSTNPNLYTKAQQVDILKKHGLNEQEISSLKDKKSRAEKILELQEKTGDIHTTELGDGPTKRSPMRYSQYQLDSLDYTKLNKPRQVEMLDSLGLSKKQIRALKYEEDRVKKLLELMEK